MEIFRFDRPRSHWHRMVLCDFVLHQHSRTSHNHILFWQCLSGDICIFFNFSWGRQGWYVLLSSSTYWEQHFWHFRYCCGALIKSLLLQLQSLLSWRRSLEIKKMHNEATATMTLKIHPQFHTLVFLGGKTSSVLTSGVYAMLPSWQSFKCVVVEMNVKLICQS